VVLVARRSEDFSVVLTEISVQNVALIEAATLELAPGLNAITGETGAGKTLLATALQMLLGGRARAEAVRSGSKKATIEGTFVLPEGIGERMLRDSLGDLAEEMEGEEEIVLRRTLSEEGRSRCYVAGVTVPVKALAALGERLVSYHGQREQVRLVEPAEQLGILDDFLDEESLRAKGALEERWSEVERERRKLAELRSSSEARVREVEFLRYQVAELEEAGYSVAEYEDLARERDRLRNVTDLLATTAAAGTALSGEEGSAAEGVARAETELDRAAGYDEGLGSC
jgi:DNA repair protein RecN (Recombination protein N)